MSSLALGFLIASIVLFAFGVLFSYKSYLKRYARAYKLCNHYPFEFNYETPFNNNILGNILFCVSSALMVAFYITFEMNHVNGFLIFITIGGVIGTLLSLSLIFIPLKMLKTHLLATVLTIAFSFLVPCAGGVYLASLYYDSRKAFQLVICILLLLVCIVIFGLVLNPKLSAWAKVEPSKDENGNEVYVRPKTMILALTEWILIYSGYVTGILMLLLTIAK